MPRRGEKRKWADCKSGSAQNRQRRNPHLTSSSRGECSKQPTRDAVGGNCSDDGLGLGLRMGHMSESIEPECQPSTSRAPPPPCSEQGDGVPSQTKDAKNNESSVPEKHILLRILKTLQRKDTYAIFAEPVDPEEVEEYYEFITEPMDFGTIRTRVNEGMYKSLQQFEQDVYLIFENAMYFNASSTVYFRQARALVEFAKKIFDTLKTDPDNFELEFNATRRRSSRKIDVPPRGSTLSIGHKPARDSGSNSAMSTDADKKGGQRQRRSHIPDIGRRSTYNPWKSDADEPNSSILSLNLGTKTFVPVDEDSGYRKSLMSFVKDLGPTAQRVAERKLQGLPKHTTMSDDASPQIPSAAPFHFLNNPFSQPVSSVTPSPYLQQEKTDDIRTRQALDKGKSVRTVSPDANTSAKPRKNDNNSRDKGDAQNRNGTVVLGLRAIQDRAHHRNHQPKESKNSHVGRFDLNQAQPTPTPTPTPTPIPTLTPTPTPTPTLTPTPTPTVTHIGSGSGSNFNNFSMPREIPFGSLAREAPFFQPMHYMPHPLYSRQFLYNSVPLFDPWLNGRNRIPRAMQLQPQLPMFSRTSFGEASSSQPYFGEPSTSQGYTGRNEGLDINQAPSERPKNRIFNLEL